MEIKPITVPRNVIETLPPPAVDNVPPPPVRGLEVPVIEVPRPVIEYPTIDAPTQAEYEATVQPPVIPQIPAQSEQTDPDRTLGEPETPPLPPAATITVPVVGEVDLPPVAPLLTAGATAVVTTTVVLLSNIALGQVKQALDGPLKRMLEPKDKKKKVKLKQKKPVLHYVRDGDQVTIFEYSVKGTKLIKTVDKPEQYIRDMIEESSVYEYDNKIIINDDIKDMFTKEGVKRFKKHFTPAKAIVKKLSARFSV